MAQVSEAMQQIDQVTQQNAALVEEMAAAGSSMSHQTGELVSAVAFFELAGVDGTDLFVGKACSLPSAACTDCGGLTVSVANFGRRKRLGCLLSMLQTCQRLGHCCRI